MSWLAKPGCGSAVWMWILPPIPPLPSTPHWTGPEGRRVECVAAECGSTRSTPPHSRGKRVPPVGPTAAPCISPGKQSVRGGSRSDRERVVGPSPALGCEVGTSSASGEMADAYVSRPFHRETGSIGDRFGEDLCGTPRAAPRLTQVSRWDACHQEPRGGPQGAEMASRCSSTAPARSWGGSVAAFKGMWPHERLGHKSWKAFVTASRSGKLRNEDWTYIVGPGLGWTPSYESNLMKGWREISRLVETAMPEATPEEHAARVDEVIDAAGARAVHGLGGSGSCSALQLSKEQANDAVAALRTGSVTADDISERGAEALTSPRPKGQRKAEAADPFRAVVRALDKLSLDRLREHCPRMSVAAHAAPPRHAIGVRHAPGRRPSTPLPSGAPMNRTTRQRPGVAMSLRGLGSHFSHRQKPGKAVT